MIVDLSHINRAGFLEACAMATKPPIVSHTGVAGAFEHWRNIDDAQLRAVADKGGCVGIIFCPKFLGGDGRTLHVRSIHGPLTIASPANVIRLRNGLTAARIRT